VRLLARRISASEERKKRISLWSRDRVIKIGRLLFRASRFKKTKRTIELRVPNVTSVTEARGSYQPAGTRPAAFACTQVRTYRSKGWLRIERTWHATTMTITSQVRKRPCRNCSTAEKKAGSRLIRAIVNLLSEANFIFTAIESFDKRDNEREM